MEKFRFIIMVLSLLNFYYPSNANPTVGQEHGSTSGLIESDLRAQEISQRFVILASKVTDRITDFETQYVQRIAALETKMQIYTHERETNNALGVTAEMIQLVMEIKEQNINLKTSLMDLKTNIAHENTEMQQTLLEIKQDITKLKEITSRHDQTFKNISNEMTQQKEDIDTEVQQLAQDHFANNVTLWTKLQVMDQEHNLRQAGNKIAFTARLKAPRTYSATSFLIFDDIITNVGGGLNSSDGMFYCSEPGLYTFFVNIMCKNNDGYASIYKNDIHVMYIYTDVHGKAWKSGSNMAILQLNKGDRVGVRARRDNEFFHYATDFSGYKLH